MTAMTDAERAVRREEQRAAWRAAGAYPDLTIDAALARGAAHHSETRLVFAPVDGEATTTTFAELWRQAGMQARRLASVGVRPGNAVVVQARADRRGTEAMIALWRLGAVVVPLVATTTTVDLVYVVGQTGARVVVTVARWRGRSIASDVASQAHDLGLDAVVVLGEDAPQGAVALDALPADGEPAPPPHEPSASPASSTPPAPPQPPRGCATATRRCSPA